MNRCEMCIHKDLCDYRRFSSIYETETCKKFQPFCEYCKYMKAYILDVDTEGRENWKNECRKWNAYVDLDSYCSWGKAKDE